MYKSLKTITTQGQLAIDTTHQPFLTFNIYYEPKPRNRGLFHSII